MPSPRLVLLPGFLGAPAPLQPLVTLLAAHGHAVEIAPLPGHGPTPAAFPAPPGGAEHGGFDAAVEALGEQLALTRRPAVLVGYSLGGRLALALAARFPAAVLDVIAVGAHPGLDDHERPARVAWEDAQRALLAAQGLEAFVAAWEALPLFATQRALPAATLAAQRAARLGHTAAGLAWALAVLGTGRMPRLLPRLAAAGRRPLFVVGEHDARFRALAEAAVAALPGSRAVIVPGAGHNVALEAPAALAALISGRLARVTAASAADTDPRAPLPIATREIPP